MKKLSLLVIGIVCSFTMFAQYPGYLQITLHKNLLLGACNLDSASQHIYIHSGAGYKSNSSLWDVVVGNWGEPDGLGEMTTLDDSTYQMCLDLTQTATNYYTINPTDSGPLPQGSTIYNIGAVFRDQGPFPMSASGHPELDNHLKGAANDDCSDIWLLGVNTGTITIVEEFDGATPVPAVNTAWVTGCGTTPNGVKDISSQLLTDIKVSPNPFTDKVTIAFNMIPDVTKVRAQVYDVMGQVVADFTPGIKGGYNTFTWNGGGIDGNALPAGTYLLKVTNGSAVQTKKLVKL